MALFSDFLSTFSPETKGVQFEKFVKWFLQNDPEWSTQVDQIWLWDDYPKRWGRDCGIDLVFKHKNGETWAVQAKCYSPEYSITKADVDKFLSESNRKGIHKRLLIATTDQLGQNARQVCKAQEKTVTHFLYSDFDKAAIEYPDNISRLSQAKRKPRPKPRTHQAEAITAIKKGFKKTDRGQLIMACGTGKTFATLWVKERLNSQLTLVLLPTLSLLSQTLREWTFASKKPFDVLCVCSDQTVGKQSNADETIHSVKDISFPVTSDKSEISKFMKSSADKVIFSTYQSSPIIAAAQVNNKIPAFELVIADEAHRCTGEVGSAFTTVLDQSLIRADKRLFTTATPKTYSTNLKKKASEMGVDVTGMDDEAIFGKVFYTLTFGEAIKRELLTDYQVVLVGVDNPMILDWIKNKQLIQTDSSDDITDAKTLASQIGLIKAIKDYDLKKVISFHSRIKRAETFAEELPKAIELLEKKHRPKGKLWTDFVSGAMSTHKRRIKLNQLKSLTTEDIGLLSNARCLSEGVDVPALDGVAFIDPRGSQIDIVQAVGRAIRLSEDKQIGTIVLPVFIENAKDAEVSVQSSSFKPVWEVLNALKAHDEVLAFELDKFRTDMGRGKKQTGAGDGLSKIVFDLPTVVDESFADSLRTLLVEKTTASWNFWFGLLAVFVDEKGHARVPSKYKTVDELRLGSWISDQRARRGKLNNERKKRLESLEGWTWDSREFKWGVGFEYLLDYVQKIGIAKVSTRYMTSDGYSLGNWVANQRSTKEQLSVEQQLKLESLLGWTWDAREFRWEEGLASLTEYSKNEGHTQVSAKYKTLDGFPLGSWVSTQRKNRLMLSLMNIGKLESLKGWAWDVLDFKWEQNYVDLIEYVEKEGSSRVPRPYKTPNGFSLGNWVSAQRKNKDQMTSLKVSKLESLKGWAWNNTKFIWEESFNNLEGFVSQEGHSLVPGGYVTTTGFNLGAWVSSQRMKKGDLSDEQKLRLELLGGWVWSALEFRWERGFSYLKTYNAATGHARVPLRYKTADGFNLGTWVSGQKENRENLSIEQRLRLEALQGWVWDALEFQWDQGFVHLKDYAHEKGNARVPSKYITADGYKLGAWVGAQKNKKQLLTNEKRSLLESLNGWVWSALEFHWEQGFVHLKDYAQEKGNARVTNTYITVDDFRLGSWVSGQRKSKNKGRLTAKNILRLESMQGWVWDVNEYKWELGFSSLEKYVEQEGNASVNWDYKTAEGFRLGAWVRHQRENKSKLTAERKSRLESLGFENT